MSFRYAVVAQLVEHRIRNAGVVGSNPINGTIFINDLACLCIITDFRVRDFCSWILSGRIGRTYMIAC